MAAATAIAALLLAAIVRPHVARPPDRWLDASLIAALIAIFLQLLPLPSPLRVALSPAVADLDASLRLDQVTGARPLSIDPAASMMSLTLAVTFVVVFWCARAAFAKSGVRAAIRSVAWLAAILSVVGMMQHLTAPELVYWTWRAPRGMKPFGPFMNRSDFASWLVMALPLTAGYAVARMRSRARNGRIAIDAATVWLAGAMCLVAAALAVALSRSGLVAGAAGLAAFAWLSSRRMSRAARPWLAFAVVVLILVAAAYANPRALSSRVDETVAAGLGPRRAIWHETWPMVRDFWATGVGAGAYQQGMVVYQQSSRAFYFNHAHNEYLQILAEGGALLAIPALCALLAAVARISDRLRDDFSPAYSMRAGAVSGMIAVAVQSCWDTGLRVPANALLFAVLAAIAMAAPPISYDDQRRTGR
jgi:O-antigen ligase